MRFGGFLLAALALPGVAVTQSSRDSLLQDRIAALEAVLAFNRELLANDARIAACGMLAPDSLRGTPGLGAEHALRLAKAHHSVPGAEADCEPMAFLYTRKPVVIVREATVLDTAFAGNPNAQRIVDLRITLLVGRSYQESHSYRAIPATTEVRRRGQESWRWIPTSWRVGQFRYDGAVTDSYELYPIPTDPP